MSLLGGLDCELKRENSYFMEKCIKKKLCFIKVCLNSIRCTLLVEMDRKNEGKKNIQKIIELGEANIIKFS